MDGSESADAPVARPAPVPGPGAQLRAARTVRAISIAQAAEALHLEEQSVTALEEERFEVLGAPVFVRGHLRRYAELLGLSAETVLEAYRASAPDSDTLPDLLGSREPPEPRRLGPWVWWLAAGVLLLLALLAWTGGRPYQALSAAASGLNIPVPAQPGIALEPQPMVPAAVVDPAPQPTSALPPTPTAAQAPVPVLVAEPADAAAIPADVAVADSPDAAGGD